MTALADVETPRLTNWLSVVILGVNLETIDEEDVTALTYGAGAVGSPEDEMFSSASSSLAFAEKGKEARVRWMVRYTEKNLWG